MFDINIYIEFPEILQFCAKYVSWLFYRFSDN